MIHPWTLLRVMYGIPAGILWCLIGRHDWHYQIDRAGDCSYRECKRCAKHQRAVSDDFFVYFE